MALVLGDPLGVTRLLRQGEQRDGRDLSGKICDAGRLRIPRRNQLLGTGQVDSVDQLVLRVGDSFAGQWDAGRVAVCEVECLGGGAVDPGGETGP